MLTRTREARPPRVAAAVVALAVLGAFAVLLRRLWPFTVDDTYITLRYARHVADGLGPTFNAAPPRAEGFTSPLWVALMVPPHRLGLDAPAVAKGAGIALVLAAAALAARFASAEARLEGGRSWAGLAAAALYLALPASAVHAISGMETALTSVLLLALCATSANAVRGGAGATRALAPLSLLLTLARPECALAGLAVLGSVAVLRPAARGTLLRGGALWFALPLVLLELARIAYYHVPLPLPFYVKLGHPGVFPGAAVVGGWLLQRAWCMGPFVLLACLRPPRALRPTLVACVVLTAFFTLPEHLMGFEHRYLAPLDPVLAVLAGIGLDRAVRFTLARGTRAGLAWAAPAALLLVCAGEMFEAGTDVPDRLRYASGLHAAHLTLAHELAAVSPRGRLVLSDAGAIPYYTDWETLDLIGLNDAHIARTRDRAPRTVLAFAPDAIVLVSVRPRRFETWSWNAYEDPIFEAALHAGFEHVATRRFAEDYWLWVLARPGSPVARALGGPS